MDIKNTIRFILDQRAQFSSDLAKINLVLQHASERRNQTEQNLLEVGQTLMKVANAQERTNEILATLAERQVATEEAIRRLADRQSTTDENLNVLLLTVERHISTHN